jgi:hypothetical protein
MIRFDTLIDLRPFSAAKIKRHPRGGTNSSKPLCSGGESANHRFLSGSAQRCWQSRTQLGQAHPLTTFGVKVFWREPTLESRRPSQLK